MPPPPPREEDEPPDERIAPPPDIPDERILDPPDERTAELLLERMLELLPERIDELLPERIDELLPDDELLAEGRDVVPLTVREEAVAALRVVVAVTLPPRDTILVAAAALPRVEVVVARVEVEALREEVELRRLLLSKVELREEVLRDEIRVCPARVASACGPRDAALRTVAERLRSKSRAFVTRREALRVAKERSG